MELNDKYKSAAYWIQLIQLELFDCVKQYLDDNNMSRKEFADKLGVSKGYVSQILNGDFDHKLSKLTELALACDLVPKIEFVPARFAEHVAKNTYLQPSDWKKYGIFIGSLANIQDHRTYSGMNDNTGIKLVSFDPTVSTANQNEWLTIDYDTKIAG